MVTTLEGSKPKSLNYIEYMIQVAHGFYHTSENKIRTYMGSSRADVRRGSPFGGLGILWHAMKCPEALENVVLAE